MFRPLALSFAMHDPAERLDAGAWRAIALAGLERQGEGLIVCGDSERIVFSSPRGAELLARLGSCGDHQRLPARLSALLEQLGAAQSRTERIAVPGVAAALHVHVVALRHVEPMHVAFWLREEVLRDDRLYEKMRDRFGTSRRTFELVQLVRQGLSNREIARELCLAESTVKVYLHELFQACGVSSRTALVALVERVGKSA